MYGTLYQIQFILELNMYTVIICSWDLAKEQLWLNAPPNTTNNPSVTQTTETVIICQFTNHRTTAAPCKYMYEHICGFIGIIVHL